METERAGRAVEERQAAQGELERVKAKLKAEGARQNAAQQALSEVARAKLHSVSRHAQLELDIKELEDKKSSDATTQVRYNGVHLCSLDGANTHKQNSAAACRMSARSSSRPWRRRLHAQKGT